MRRHKRGKGFIRFELIHAVPANAGAVAGFGRHLLQQRRRDFLVGAPARPFAGAGRAKLAFIGVAAKRTTRRIGRKYVHNFDIDGLK